MAKYLILFHGGQGMADSPEAQQAVMAEWAKWYEGMGQAVVDGGDPTSHAKTVQSDGSVADGGGQNPVTGYAIINAGSMDEAVEHARLCPHLKAGGTVEVAETFQMS